MRVFLADDHQMFVAGVAKLLEEDADLELVGTACDGRTATRDLIRLMPDVAILSLTLPMRSGTQVLADVLAKTSRVRGLLLADTDRSNAVYTVMAAGASGFLLKTGEGSELIAAIKEIAAGDVVVAHDLLGLLAKQIKQREGPAILTRRELDILNEAARDQSTAVIAATLNLAQSTVRTYISRINRKLGVSGLKEAVAEATALGLLEE